MPSALGIIDFPNTKKILIHLLFMADLNTKSRLHKPLGRLCNLLFMYAELAKVQFFCSSSFY